MTWSMIRRGWISCAGRPSAQNTSPRSARDRWCWAQPDCSGATAPRRTGRRWIFLGGLAERAEGIQLRLEYTPAPPFNAGSPDTAPPEILALMKEKIAPAQARRGEAIARAAARLA